MSIVFRRLSNKHRGMSGFTLLELVIVLVVLAALAALVVPTLGYVRDQAKFATAAAGAAELMNNIELYKASTGSYPNRMDSLVNSSGSVYTKVYGDGSTPVHGAIKDDSSFIYYYLSNAAGMTEVMQHDEAATNPNESTDTVAPTPIASAKFYVIDPTSANATYAAKTRRIIRSAYPNQTGTGGNVAIPANHYLVAMGVGSRTSSNGSTMTSAPVYGGAAADKYGRYIALFDVWAGSTGRGRVQLKAILDSEFEVLAKNVDNFKKSGPSDDQGVYTPPATP